MPIGLITGLATSLLGTGMSIAQMVQANKEKKAAQNAAAAARKRIEGISSANPFAEEKVADQGYKMAMDAIKSGTAQGLQALQGVNDPALFLSGVGNLTENARAGALETGAKLAEEQAALSQRRAEAQVIMNKDKEQRLSDLYKLDLEGAGTATAEAQANKNAAIGGIFESAGSGLAAGLGAIPTYFKNPNLEKWFGNTTT
jgi:hypothetical protein